MGSEMCIRDRNNNLSDNKEKNIENLSEKKQEKVENKHSEAN